MDDFGLLGYLALFLTGGLAGFVDSIAGGGGLIALPVLLAFGVPAHQALATNKLQSSFGSFTAATNYARRGLMRPKTLLAGVFHTFIGAVAGAASVRFFSAGFLETLIIFMLAAILIYNLLTPRLGLEPGPARMAPQLFYLLAGLTLGFYDGFFGPGAGSFWTMALVFLAGLNLKTATAQTKLFNFTSNIVSLAVFASFGLVLWGAGLTMGVGQVAGAWAGSTLASKREARFIRYFFLAVTAATIAKLLWGRLA